MSVDSVLAAGRRAAESRMLDTWAIGTLSTEYDEDAGAEVRTVSPLFTTPGRLTDRGTTVARDTQVGERTAIETTRELHIPYDSPAAPANAVAECTAVHATSDPTLLGTIVRLAGPSPASQKTARRLEVVEVLT